MIRSRSVAAQQIRDIRRDFYAMPANMRRIFRYWVVAECQMLLKLAPMRIR